MVLMEFHPSIFTSAYEEEISHIRIWAEWIDVLFDTFCETIYSGVEQLKNLWNDN